MPTVCDLWCHSTNIVLVILKTWKINGHYPTHPFPTYSVDRKQMGTGKPQQSLQTTVTSNKGRWEAQNSHQFMQIVKRKWAFAINLSCFGKGNYPQSGLNLLRVILFTEGVSVWFLAPSSMSCVHLCKSLGIFPFILIFPCQCTISSKRLCVL